MRGFQCGTLLNSLFLLQENFINKLKGKWPQLDALIPTQRDNNMGVSTPLRLKSLTNNMGMIKSATKLSPAFNADGTKGDGEAMESPIILTESKTYPPVKNGPRGGTIHNFVLYWRILITIF